MFHEEISGCVLYSTIQCTSDGWRWVVSLHGQKMVCVPVIFSFLFFSVFGMIVVRYGVRGVLFAAGRCCCWDLLEGPPPRLRFAPFTWDWDEWMDWEGGGAKFMNLGWCSKGNI